MKRGIDISSYQKGLDVSTLRGKGIDFVILKSGEGRTLTDPCFDQFYSEAVKTGISVGAYFYSYATTTVEAIRDAQRALILANGRSLPLGIYMDVEDSSQLALSDSSLTAVVKAWCDTIRAGGYRPGAYGSDDNLWAKVGPSYLGEDVLIWDAKWSSVRPRLVCDIWQYTKHLTVQGYSGPIDGDNAMSERFLALLGEHEVASEPQPDQSVEETSFTLRIPSLQYGDFGDMVKALQGELIAFGYSCGGKKDWRGAEKPDGIFGAVTKESVQKFQRAHDITADGVVRADTRAALICAEVKQYAKT